MMTRHKSRCVVAVSGLFAAPCVPHTPHTHCPAPLLQAKQLVLELSQPVAAICYRAADRDGISRQGKAAAAAVLEALPDVLGEQCASLPHLHAVHATAVVSLNAKPGTVYKHVTTTHGTCLLLAHVQECGWTG